MGGITDHFPQILFHACAEFLGHEDAETLGQALDNPQHHPVHPVGCAQGGKGVYSQGPANHHGIHHGVKLLEYIADHQRQCKGKDQGKGLSLSHVFDS